MTTTRPNTVHAGQDAQPPALPLPVTLNKLDASTSLLLAGDGEVIAVIARAHAHRPHAGEAMVRAVNHHDALAGALAALLVELDMAECTGELPREMTDKLHPLMIQWRHAKDVLKTLVEEGEPPPPAPVLTLAVIVEGGMVQAILANRPAAIARAVVIDYDVDGADIDDTTDVPQQDGRDVPAYVRAFEVEQSKNAAIDLAEVLRRADAGLLPDRQEA